MSEACDPLGMVVLRRMLPSGEDTAQLGWQFHLARLAETLLGPTRERCTALRMRQLGWHAHRLMKRHVGWADAALRDRLEAIRCELRPGRAGLGATVEALAILGVIAERTLGLRPFSTQMAGALVLYSGRLAEMETGSGKTLTAALAAALAVLSGQQVHVITSNDYLARRDHETLAAFYTAIGCKVGVIVHDVPPADRRKAYSSDIVYASNKEIAFDYLRNRITVGSDASAIRLLFEALSSPRPRLAEITMTGLPLAIVDEADSVLVDECRTPLIISATEAPEPEWAETALRLADELAVGADYNVESERRVIELTRAGRNRLKTMGEALGGIWRHPGRREHAAIQGLSARLLFQRDDHYLVRDGKVQLIDEYSGRVADDRSLGDGLQQVIEAKEGVEISGRRRTLGRMTYQRFFRRYGRLAGMTGTAREVGPELAAVYGLHVVRIPSSRRSRRRVGTVRILATEDRKWRLAARRAVRLSQRGIPVLLATRTVRASERLAAELDALGATYALLNAAQTSEEAEVIAGAGQRGRITVATNMAGRGVDIRLGDGVDRLGGLHVILTERHESARIDRQVMGRCARQGDPGRFEEVLSREDALVQKFGGWKARSLISAPWDFVRAQRRAERLHARARFSLLQQDLRRDEHLSFSGRSE